MTQIVVNETLRNMLQNFTKPLELCNESGEVLARLTPVSAWSHYEPLEPQISEEELRRRSQSNEKTYTTAEVLAFLEKL